MHIKVEGQQQCSTVLSRMVSVCHCTSCITVILIFDIHYFFKIIFNNLFLYFVSIIVLFCCRYYFFLVDFALFSCDSLYFLLCIWTWYIWAESLRVKKLNSSCATPVSINSSIYQLNPLYFDPFRIGLICTRMN